MSSYEICICDVTLKKEGKKLLSSVSCVIPVGKMTVLIGPNGAGKTSLLRSVLGLESFEGQIFLGAKDLQALSQKERSQSFAWAPAQSRLAFPFPCLEVVCMGRFSRHGGFPSREDYEHSRRALELVGMEEKVFESSDKLSSGEFQKLMISRVLASENPILLFDEPDSFLDISCVQKILLLLKEWARFGKTVCISLHDLNLAAQFADYGLLLDQGSLLYQGDFQELVKSDLLPRVYQIDIERSEQGSHKSLSFHLSPKACQKTLSMVKEFAKGRV